MTVQRVAAPIVKSGRCEFCNALLDDPMLAFLDHIETHPSCRTAWELWRENVRREAGGT